MERTNSDFENDNLQDGKLLLKNIFNGINLLFLQQILENEENVRIILKINQELELIDKKANLEKISKILKDAPEIINIMITHNLLELNKEIIELSITYDYSRDSKKKICYNLLKYYKFLLDSEQINAISNFLFVVDPDIFYKYSKNNEIDFEFNKKEVSKLLRNNIDINFIEKYSKDDNITKIIDEGLLEDLIKFNYNLSKFKCLLNSGIFKSEHLSNGIRFSIIKTKVGYFHALSKYCRKNEIRCENIKLTEKMVNNILEHLFFAYFLSPFVDISYFINRDSTIVKYLINKINCLKFETIKEIKNILESGWFHDYIDNYENKSKLVIDIYKLGKYDEFNNCCKKIIKNIDKKYFDPNFISYVQFDIDNYSCKRYANEIMSIIINKQNKLFPTCSICLSNHVSHVLSPCGHTICYECSDKIYKCHICREDIDDAIKFYM